MLEAYQRLLTDRDLLIASSSQRDYELAVQMSLVVVQWESMKRTNSSTARDVAMAANVGWLLDRIKPKQPEARSTRITPAAMVPLAQTEGAE